MKKLLLLTLVILGAFQLSGQQFELGLFIGATNYQGDLVLNNIQISESKAAFGLVGRIKLNDQLGLRANVITGKISGADANYPERESRGYFFETDLIESSILLEYSFLKSYRKLSDENSKPSRRKGSPYVFVGLGALSFSPEVNGLSENAPEIIESYNQLTFVVPIGFGYKFDLNERLGFGLELGFRGGWSDHLDGISESGNPKSNDWYEFAGATMRFYLGKLEQ